MVNENDYNGNVVERNGSFLTNDIPLPPPPPHLLFIYLLIFLSCDSCSTERNLKLFWSFTVIYKTLRNGIWNFFGLLL